MLHNDTLRCDELLAWFIGEKVHRMQILEASPTGSFIAWPDSNNLKMITPPPHYVLQCKSHVSAFMLACCAHQHPSLIMQRMPGPNTLGHSELPTVSSVFSTLFSPGILHHPRGMSLYRHRQEGTSWVANQMNESNAKHVTCPAAVT